ncbi:MAG: hypothetical protein AAGI53_01550 [Planctomycetota bacterium]
MRRGDVLRRIDGALERRVPEAVAGRIAGARAANRVGLSRRARLLLDIERSVAGAPLEIGAFEDWVSEPANAAKLDALDAERVELELILRRTDAEG